MKLNIQLFGGRGQNSKGKRTKVNKQRKTNSYYEKLTPIESNYIEKGNWKEQKKSIEQRYKKKYDNVVVRRARSDTKGLYTYYVYGDKKKKEGE